MCLAYCFFDMLLCARSVGHDDDDDDDDDTYVVDCFAGGNDDNGDVCMTAMMVSCMRVIGSYVSRNASYRV